MIKKVCTILITLVFIFNLFEKSANGQNKYELNIKTELLTGSIGSGLFLASMFTSKNASFTINDLNNLDKSQINSFDRSATKFYSKELSTLSDVLLITSVSLPAIVFLTNNETKEDLQTIGFMYLETLLITNGITNLTKNLTERFRPIAYNPNVPASIKIDPDTRKSFFSGHTSVSFASAVFFSEVFSNYSDDKKLNTFVWIGSLTLATGTGLLRYFSGKHFPTDILAGSVVGSLIGYAIPKIHQKNSALNLNQSYGVINISYRFNSIATR